MDEDMEKKEDVKEESPENSTDSKEDSPGSGETAPADNGNPESENTLADDVTQETDNSGTDEKTDTETGSAENKEDGSSATDEKNGTDTEADSAENKEDDLYDRLVADIAEKIANGEIVTSSGEEYTEELPPEPEAEEPVFYSEELLPVMYAAVQEVEKEDTIYLNYGAEDMVLGYQWSQYKQSDGSYLKPVSRLPKKYLCYNKLISVDSNTMELSVHIGKWETGISPKTDLSVFVCFYSDGSNDLWTYSFPGYSVENADCVIDIPEGCSQVGIGFIGYDYGGWENYFIDNQNYITHKYTVQEEKPGENTGDTPSGGTVVSPVPFNEITLADMSVTDGLLLCILMVTLFKCLFSYGRRIFS